MITEQREVSKEREEEKSSEETADQRTPPRVWADTKNCCSIYTRCCDRWIRSTQAPYRLASTRVPPDQPPMLLATYKAHGSASA